MGRARRPAGKSQKQAAENPSAEPMECKQQPEYGHSSAEDDSDSEMDAEHSEVSCIFCTNVLL